jgi:hypothetical protein
MTDANITPGTVGGRFTNIVPWVCSPVVFAQDGGRRRAGGWTGSGSPLALNSLLYDDGSASGVSGTWVSLVNAEGLKHSIWGSKPFTSFPSDYALGSMEQHVSTTNYFTTAFTSGYSVSSAFPGQLAYFDNAFNGGEAGPDIIWLRDGGNWGVVSSNPAPGITDTGSVKTYPANQFNFTTPVPVSSFSKIRGYASVYDPDLPASSYPAVDYEAAWDIFGTAHGLTGISFEVMFWTRNHLQSPVIGPAVEVNFDLNHDGKLWNLYLAQPDGGVAGAYTFSIWYLQDSFQEEAGWIDILAGVRHVLKYYVITSGGAPANPLNVPLTQITRGWEICSTNYAPLEFRHLDFQLEIS